LKREIFTPQFTAFLPISGVTREFGSGINALEIGGKHFRCLRIGGKHFRCLRIRGEHSPCLRIGGTSIPLVSGSGGEKRQKREKRGCSERA
jgi:hypothetical protein